MALRENHICPHRGEEFRVVDYLGSTETAADDLKGALDLVRDRQLQTRKTESVNIAFSTGIAELGPDGKTLDKLLKNAGRALYFAKANGRSCVIPYSADLFEKRETTLITRLDQQLDKQSDYPGSAPEWCGQTMVSCYESKN